MEIRHLQYFVAVAETRHFGQAAERLHMAQSPLSQAIRQLESHVGALYLEEPAEVDEYRRIFDLINKDAVPVEEYR